VYDVCACVRVCARVCACVSKNGVRNTCVCSKVDTHNLHMFLNVIGFNLVVNVTLLSV